MNILTAQSTLTELIAKRQGELDSLTLALSVLDSTFAPDISAIALAQKDADDQRVKVAETTTALDSEKVAHANEVVTLTSEKDALITEAVAKDKTIEDLQAQVVALTTPAETPAKPIVP